MPDTRPLLLHNAYITVETLTLKAGPPDGPEDTHEVGGYRVFYTDPVGAVAVPVPETRHGDVDFQPLQSTDPPRGNRTVTRGGGMVLGAVPSRVFETR